MINKLREQHYPTDALIFPKVTNIYEDISLIQIYHKYSNLQAEITKQLPTEAHS